VFEPELKTSKLKNTTQESEYTVSTKQQIGPWYLYMVQTKYQHLYTGITLDYRRRFEEHNSQSPKCAKALKGKGPLSLKYCIELPDQRTALQAEIWLKKQTKFNKLSIIAKHKDVPFTHTFVVFEM
jgi:putative endonuclease